MTRATYNDETKAQVMAALLTGQSISVVAKAYQVPRATVGRWRTQAAAIIETERAQKSTDIDVLLRGYLEESLTTLREQAIFFRDQKWLRQQDASAAAVLHGVITDKAIRLLEAFGGEPTA